MERPTLKFRLSTSEQHQNPCPSHPLPDTYHEGMTTDSERALFLAIQADDAGQVRSLVRAEAGLLGALSPMGMSPVLFATSYGKHEMARLLIEEGAPLDVYGAAAVGDTAHLEAQLDADPGRVNTPSPGGFSALGLAALFGRAEVATLLLLRGADVGAVSANALGAQPLHSAVAGNHAELARVLLEAGADVNATQHGGFTPLMGAAQNGNAALVAALLARGANALAQTGDGRTAADLAQEEGHAGVLAALKG